MDDTEEGKALLKDTPEIVDLDPISPYHRSASKQRISLRLLMRFMMAAGLLLGIGVLTLMSWPYLTHSQQDPAPTPQSFTGSSPQLLTADNTLYLYTGKNIQALKLTTGAQLWSYQSPEEIHFVQTSADSNVVLLEGKTGNLIALDMKTGEFRWQLHLTSTGWNILTSYNNTILLFTAPQGIVAIRMTDGSELWQYGSTNTLNIDSTQNDLTLLDTSNQMVIRLDIQTGQSIMSYHLDGTLNGVMQGKIYIIESDQSMSAIQLSDGKKLWNYKNPNLTIGYLFSVGTNNQAYLTSQDGQIYAIGTDDGQERWHTRIDSGDLPVVLEQGDLANENVFLNGNAGMLAIISSVDGKVLWKTTKAVYNTLSCAPTIICFQTDNGVLSAVDRESGSELWNVQKRIAWVQYDDTHLYIFDLSNTASKPNALSALHMTDGKLLWSLPMKSPLTDYHLIAQNYYLLQSLGTLELVRLSDGKILWKKPSRPLL
ncbi:PQQ-like beta-propeller repeat protein [Tengunoibacter tsumagoiensis]|uniref:Pyrrolo-quinoline quinone repeat domain-containing protein n=1 Tax=Tengunoibacter tsumagoiensis TaxID=2014871 RepID=A0A401ZXQ0_9CHLR|nr:PQQ-like beta-propeller repeat protein [Tengunoibacter tsumagoiensis]GCE11636.1 hypothetical protein KTT_14950 [Tengunoibacter tsumagoiensis]